MYGTLCHFEIDLLLAHIIKEELVLCFEQWILTTSQLLLLRLF